MDWLAKLKSAEKTALIQDGKRKVHYKFSNEDEMAEEYNIETNILVRRAWKRGGALRKTGQWEVEVGDPEPVIQSFDVGIKENANSPYIVKRITKTNIEWRIRNLSYPVETYSVTADANARCIIVSTTNKKYYKKVYIEELDRVNLCPEQKNIDFSHKYNTLIITYKKPPQVLDLEQKVLQELKNVKTIKDGDLPCKPS
uniref:Protein DPCD n=1 Tax=Panstrongylus lignarius TaxID=156445 RepID=A0A224XYJ7_9HEMI